MTWRGRVAVMVVAAVASTGFGGVSPASASADEEAAFSELRTHRLWTGLADARPVSPYIEGTFAEFTFGVPYSQSYLEGNPGRAGAISTPTYASETGETLLELLVDGYSNPTVAMARFPDFQRDNREEFAPGGPAGPRAEAHARTRTEAESLVRITPATGVAGVEGGFARTRSRYDKQDFLLEEAESALVDLRLPGGIRVGELISSVKVENHLGREPLVSYRFALSDVENGPERIIGTGDDGFVLAGVRVPVGDLERQFERALTAAAPALRDLTALSLAITAPAVERHDSGGYLVTGVVLRLTKDNTALFTAAQLEGKVGRIVGVRLGYTRVFSHLVSFDK